MPLRYKLLLTLGLTIGLLAFAIVAPESFRVLYSLAGLSVLAFAFVVAFVFIAAFVFPCLPIVPKPTRRPRRLLYKASLKFYRQQLTALAPSRVAWTIVLHLLAAGIMFSVLTEPLPLLWMALAALAYVVAVSALILSMLGSMPFFAALWNGVAFRLGLLVFPLVVGFVVKGYAGVWIGENLHISASNTPHALFAATGSLLCAIAGLALGASSFFFELLGLLNLRGTFDKSDARRLGVPVLMLVSMASAFIGAHFAGPFAGPLGRTLISAIAFEFDATPATACVLTLDEERLARTTPDPILKVLHLSSSQEKGILVKRSAALFREARLKDLQSQAGDERKLEIGRTVECYKVLPDPPEKAASQPIGP